MLKHRVMSCYAKFPWSDNFVPINPLLQCGEEWIQDHEQYQEEDDDDDCFHGPITFHIRLQNGTHRLNFNCRDKSSGVLLPSEPSMKKEDTYDGPSDPFFFEKGFYLEAKTGFQVWPGSRLMVEAFTCSGQNNEVNAVMKNLKDQLSLGGLNVLEVGAGIGVVGSCLAAAGGNVLITDLPVLVTHGIGPNLRRNARANQLRIDADEEGCDQEREQLCPTFLADASTLETTTSDTPSFNPINIGRGWAKSAVLDWFKPVEGQLPLSTTMDIDVIVACDCIFLRKLADPLLTTIATIFQHSSAKNTIFFFTFQRRNMLGLFIQLEELLGMIEKRGWTVECVAWRDVEIEDDGVHQNYLFQVTPGGDRIELADGSSAATINSTFIEEEKKE